jgi:intracellular sulfur oxidation DsrE/DsrF family protein
MEPHSRRIFITSTGTAASVVAGVSAFSSPLPTRAADRPNRSPAVPFLFDRAAFQAIVDRPSPHRQFAAPDTFGSATVAMSHFTNSLTAYADPNGFAGGPDSLHCAAVLYSGRSYLMVLDDAMFAKYQVGRFVDEELRPNDTTYRKYWTGLQHNPMADFLKPLTEAGVSFFVCNNSLSGFAYELAQKAAKGAPVKQEAVISIHSELAAHFISSTMLVPAGVAAVNAVQEARFTFLP